MMWLSVNDVGFCLSVVLAAFAIGVYLGGRWTEAGWILSAEAGTSYRARDGNFYALRKESNE